MSAGKSWTPRPYDATRDPREWCASVLAVVSEHFAVNPAEVMGRRRTARIATVRGIAIYLASEAANLHIRDVAEYFGRDRSTALDSVERVRRRAMNDQDFRAQLSELVRLVDCIGERDAPVSVRAKVLEVLHRAGDHIVAWVDDEALGYCFLVYLRLRGADATRWAFMHPKSSSYQETSLLSAISFAVTAEAGRAGL